VRPQGSREFFTQTEVKNLNSVRALKGAIEYEAKRQIGLHERGEPVLKQTLLWDEKAGETAPMRSKETAEDYRYFPEPDLPPLVIGSREVEQIRASLPELPAQRKERYVAKLGLSEYDASVITADPAYADYYEKILKAGADPKPAANWLTTEVAGALNEEGIGIAEFRVEPEAIAELIRLVRDCKVTGKAAKEVFAEMVTSGGNPSAIVEAKGLGLVQDDALLGGFVDEVIAAEQALIEKYKSGKTQVLGALVGAVMKKSRGKFPPQKVSELLAKKLS